MLARELAGAPQRLRLFTGAPLRRLLKKPASFHLAKDTFALHLLFQDAERLVHVVVANEHLKMIDVVCLDPDGSVRTRYDEFIRFQYYRFFNRSTEEYLQFVMRESEGNRTEKTFDKLEASHRNFASNYPTDNRK